MGSPEKVRVTPWKYLKQALQLLSHGGTIPPKAPVVLANLYTLESKTILPSGVTLESWFIRSGSAIIRSEVYKLEDGSVVAFQDTVNGKNSPLHMDAAFKALYEDEDQYSDILHYSGVLDPSKIHLYHMG